MLLTPSLTRVASIPLTPGSSAAKGFVGFGCTGAPPSGARLSPKGVGVALEVGPVALASASRKFEENLAPVREVGLLSDIAR